MKEERKVKKKEWRKEATLERWKKENLKIESSL